MWNSWELPRKILLDDLEKLISQPYFLLFVSTAIWWLVLYSYWLKGNWMVYPLCFYQSQPVLKLQTDDDEQTNSRVLTCFLLPQQGLGSLGKYMLNVFPCIFCNLSILWTEFSALSWIRLAWMDENLSMNYNCEVELFVSYCDHFECGSQCFESFSVFFSVWRRLTECTWNTVIQIYSVYIEKKMIIPHVQVYSPWRLNALFSLWPIIILSN